MSKQPDLGPLVAIGLMSGTSLDGVDGVLADFSGTGVRVLAHAARPFEAPLRAELLALNTRGSDELHRAALAANALVAVYTQVVHDLLAASDVPATAVRAIGAHGQTVRHQPQAFGGTGYTLQLNNPALLAERTGVDVVADDEAEAIRDSNLAFDVERRAVGGQVTRDAIDRAAAELDLAGLQHAHARPMSLLVHGR